MTVILSSSSYSQVDLQGNDILKVKAGDRYGFTWLNFGVIDWGMTAEKNYCEKEAIYDVGDTASLNDQHGNREYSIKMRLTACDGSTPKCGKCELGPIFAYQYTLVINNRYHYFEHSNKHFTTIRS